MTANVVKNDSFINPPSAGFLLPTCVVLNDTTNLTQARILLAHLYGAANVVSVRVACSNIKSTCPRKNPLLLRAAGFKFLNP